MRKKNTVLPKSTTKLKALAKNYMPEIMSQNDPFKRKVFPGKLKSYAQFSCSQCFLSDTFILFP